VWRILVCIIRLQSDHFDVFTILPLSPQAVVITDPTTSSTVTPDAAAAKSTLAVQDPPSQPGAAGLDIGFSASAAEVDPVEPSAEIVIIRHSSDSSATSSSSMVAGTFNALALLLRNFFDLFFDAVLGTISSSPVSATDASTAAAAELVTATSLEEIGDCR
jgi:hypothetical protein